MRRPGLGPHLSLLLDTKVVTGAPSVQKPLDHLWVVKPDPELETRKTRLRHHELGCADPKPVTDRYLVLEGKALDGQVLTKRADRKFSPKLLTPEGVMLSRIHVDRLVEPTVHGKVGLPVAG